jgi:hypothetical protein
MVPMHLLTADPSVERMARADAVLAELHALFCTIKDVKFSSFNMAWWVRGLTPPPCARPWYVTTATCGSQCTMLE